MNVGSQKMEKTLATSDPQLIQSFIQHTSNNYGSIPLTKNGIDLIKFGGYLYYINSLDIKKHIINCRFNNPVFFKNKINTVEQLILYFNGFTSDYKINFLPAIDTKLEPCSENSFDYDKVILFSGGLDSLSQVMQSMLKKEKIILCHTDHNRKIDGKVKKTITKLEEIFETEIDLAKIDYYKMRGGKIKIINSRASTYALNGIAIAEAVNAKEVLIPENGAVATLPKFDISVETTRTVYPFLMEKIARIAYKLTRIKLSDPLAKKTKTESMKIFMKYEELIPFSYSCSHPGRRDLPTISKEIGQCHCGTCLACFIRLVSLSALHLSEHEDTYFRNPLEFDKKVLVSQKPSIRKDFYSIISFIDYCKDLVFFSEITDFNIFVQESIKLNQNSSFPLFQEVDILKLQKQFALEIFRGINNYYENNSLKAENYIIGREVTEIDKL